MARGPSIQGLDFQLWTDADVRRASACEVTQAALMAGGSPAEHGMLDPRMGSTTLAIRCATCGGSCRGHMGHMELAAPVFRPGAAAMVKAVLQAVCFACARPKWTPGEDPYSATVRNRVCPHCDAVPPVYRFTPGTAKMFLEWEPRPEHPRDQASYLKSNPLTPRIARGILAGVPLEAQRELGFVGASRAEHLVCETQVVPPPGIRPGMERGRIDDLTNLLIEVLKASNAVAACDHEPEAPTRHPRDHPRFRAEQVLQLRVLELARPSLGTDIKLPGTFIRSLAERRARAQRRGLDDRLKGKEGRFRHNLSGKRNNFAGRSVIGPDSDLDIWLVGLPDEIMRTLTVPERVTSWNGGFLGDAVRRGAADPLGAKVVIYDAETPHETVVILDSMTPEERHSVAQRLPVGAVVERFMRDGDPVAFNRQPTLRETSIMGFRAVRVPGKTIRFSEAVCQPFNADFDGDEMNVHLPQSLLARAELEEIMFVVHHVVSAQRGTPVMGMIQDALLAAFKLTRPDVFLDRSEFFQLAMGVHHDLKALDPAGVAAAVPPGAPPPPRLVSRVPRPAILKGDRVPPGGLYTGAQAASLATPRGVDLERRAGADPFAPGYLLVRDGELLAGRLGKATLGAVPEGLVAVVHRLFGAWGVAKWISDCKRVLIRSLAVLGASVGLRDGIVDEAVADRVKAVARTAAAAAAAHGDDEARAFHVLARNLNDVAACVLPPDDAEPRTGFAYLTRSGAKGSSTNEAQMKGAFGQVTVYGGRPEPVRAHARAAPRTLVGFAPGERNPRARGFVRRGFVAGLRPDEAMFTAIAGREGLIDTACKTAPSGYLQRRLVALQGAGVVAHDFSVRNAAGGIIQFAYGHDSLDPAKIYPVRVDPARRRAAGRRFPWLEDLLRARELATGKPLERLELPFDYTSLRGLERSRAAATPAAAAAAAAGDADVGVLVSGFLESLRGEAPDIVLAGAAMELELAAGDPAWLVERILEQARHRILRARVSPGTAAATLASLSIGEPQTQLTLNTFHFSGVSSMIKVTEGLPRVEELTQATDVRDRARMELFAAGPGVDLADLRAVSFEDALVSTHIGPGGSGPRGFRYLERLFPGEGVLVLRLRPDLDAKQVAAKLLERKLVEVCAGHRGYVWIAVEPSTRSAAWVQLDQLRRANPVLCGVAHVRRVLARGGDRFETEGSNFAAVLGDERLDFRRCLTTNVPEVLATLGVEAARTMLYRELTEVLASVGTYISPRHMGLLVDSMTQAGGVAPLNRSHFREFGGSVIASAAFEQGIDHMQRAAFFGKKDLLEGPFEQIIVGREIQVGTGFVETLDLHPPEPPTVPPLAAAAAAAEPLAIGALDGPTGASEPLAIGALDEPSGAPGSLAIGALDDPDGASGSLAIGALEPAATTIPRGLSIEALEPGPAEPRGLLIEALGDRAVDAWTVAPAPEAPPPAAAGASAWSGARLDPEAAVFPDSDSAPWDALAAQIEAMVRHQATLAPAPTELEVRFGTVDPASGRFRPGVSREWFVGLLARFEAVRGWDSYEFLRGFHQTTDVVYRAEPHEAPVRTSVEFLESLEAPGTFDICKTHVIKTRVRTSVAAGLGGAAVRVALNEERSLDASEVPVAVVPEDIQIVRVKQRKTFRSRGWLVEFTRVWSGRTIREAEFYQLTAPPVYELEVEKLPEARVGVGAGLWAPDPTVVARSFAAKVRACGGGLMDRAEDAAAARPGPPAA